MMLLAFSDSTEHTIGGSREARIVSTDNTATGRIIQPLTLCPNTTYNFSGWTRQSRVLAECQATFSLNGTAIGIVAPGNQWSSGIGNLKNYTVGYTPEVDFTIDVKCTGGGVSDGSPGTIDFDDLMLEQAF